MWCFTSRAINGLDTKNKKGRTDTVAFDLSKVKQLKSLTDPNDTQQKFEHEFMDANCDQKLQHYILHYTKLNTLLIAKKL